MSSEPQDTPAAPSPAPGAVVIPRALMYALVVIALASLAFSGALWHKLGNIQEQLARQSQESGNNATEARLLGMSIPNAFHFGVGNPGPGRHNGIVFHGKESTLAIVNYGTPVVTDRNGKPVEGQSYPPSVPPSPGHEREFLDSIKSRKECSCSFAYHLPQHTAMNLAHLSLRLGRKLHWDAEKWQVTGDREATAQLTPRYRAPWKLPSA